MIRKSCTTNERKNMKMHLGVIRVIACVLLTAVSFCTAEMPALVNPFVNQPVYPLSVYCEIPGSGVDSQSIYYYQLPFDGQLQANVTGANGFANAKANTQQGFIEVTLSQTKGGPSVGVFTTTLPTSGLLEISNPYDGSVTFGLQVWAPSDNGMQSNQTKLLGLILWKRNSSGMQWWVDKWENGSPVDPRIAEGTDAFDFNNLSNYINLIRDGRTLGYYMVTLNSYSENGNANQVAHGRIDFAQWRKLTVSTLPLNNIPVQPGIGEFSYPEHANVPIVAEQYNNCPDVYVFDHWEGQGILDPNAASTTVLMDTNVQITAVFTATRNCGDACHLHPAMDFNHDCIVDLVDLAEILSDWLLCTKPECD